MKITHLILFALLILVLKPSYTLAHPTVKDWQKATLAFTMIDADSKLSYVIDLEINLIDFIENRQPFEFDVLAMLNEHSEVKMSDISDYRWSIVGAVDDAVLLKDKQFKIFNGYVSAYKASALPHADNLNHLRQKTKRLEYYFKDGLYSSSPHEVSIRNSGMKSGYFDSGWQGNFNGLDSANMQAKGEQSLTLWSLMAVDLEKLRRSRLGTVSLSKNGVLKFMPTQKNS